MGMLDGAVTFFDLVMEGAEEPDGSNESGRNVDQNDWVDSAWDCDTCKEKLLSDKRFSLNGLFIYPLIEL